MGRERVWTEEYTVDSVSLHARLRDIIREGKARRIIVKNSQGKTVLKVPLWLGAAVVLKNPRVLLLGALMSSREPLTLVVEKVDQNPEPLSEHQPGGGAASKSDG
jgi:hypothetical protein